MEEKGDDYSFEFLQKLLIMPVSKRKMVAKTENTESYLAAFSLSYPSAVFINLYAGLIGKKFWETYDLLKDPQSFYTDTTNLNKIGRLEQHT